MLIERRSIFSGKINSQEIDVTQDQLDAWTGGEMIQNAMPNLSPDEREFIKTGVTAQEWEKAFGPVENL